MVKFTEPKVQQKNWFNNGIFHNYLLKMQQKGKNQGIQG